MRLFFIAPYCFGLEKSLADALAAQGVQIERFIYGEHNREKGPLARSVYNHYGLVRAAKGLMGKMGILNQLLKRSLERTNVLLLERIARFKPDAVFIVKGEILFPETLQAIKRICPLACYYWDDPFLRHIQKLDSSGDIRYQNLTHSYSYYDVAYVYDETYVQPLLQAGIRDVIFLMSWYEPEFYKPMELSETLRRELACDVAFVGAPYPNRIELLRSLAGLDVGVWGPEFRWREYFRRYPFLVKQYRGESSAGRTAQIYNAAKIVLNIHDQFQCVSSVNPRTYQILACGAFQLVDDRPALHQLFDVGVDLVAFQSPEEALTKAQHYLSHPEERQRIQNRGRSKAQGNSAIERAQLILQHLRPLIVPNRIVASSVR